MNAGRAASPGRLNFIVCGTPRSGTTLVQRLLLEIEGVGMPPETHFFGDYSTELADRCTFPLTGDRLRSELHRFAARRESEGLAVNVDRLMEELNGLVESPWELFEGIAVHLSPGVDVRGEKTPHHLSWWEPLARAFPDLRFVFVVRDPRAVVASALKVAWGMSTYDGIAFLWRSDQRQVEKALSALGERAVRVRYEDVVREPGGIRESLAAHLGIEQMRVREAGSLVLGVVKEWETWKAGVEGPIEPERADAWRSALDPTAEAQIVAICEKEMRALGYDIARSGSRAGALARLGPRRLARWAKFGLGRWARMRRIARYPQTASGLDT